MSRLDRIAEQIARKAANSTSRRSFLGRLGLVSAAATLPLLPVRRGQAAPTQGTQPQEKGDPESCDYWRYCAIDGYLC